MGRPAMGHSIGACRADVRAGGLRSVTCSDHVCWVKPRLWHMSMNHHIEVLHRLEYSSTMRKGPKVTSHEQKA